MSVKTECDTCGMRLLFSARLRGNGLCGACTRMTSERALREAVELVAERCSCHDGNCPFREPGGQHTNGGCQMIKDRLRGHQLGALGKLFTAARALLGDAQPIEPTPADVWRAEAERLRHLLGEMVHVAWNQPQPWPKHHREWLERMEREVEQSP